MSMLLISCAVVFHFPEASVHFSPLFSLFFPFLFEPQNLESILLSSLTCKCHCSKQKRKFAARRREWMWSYTRHNKPTTLTSDQVVCFIFVVFWSPVLWRGKIEMLLVTCDAKTRIDYLKIEKLEILALARRAFLGKKCDCGESRLEIQTPLIRVWQSRNVLLVLPPLNQTSTKIYVGKLEWASPKKEFEV